MAKDPDMLLFLESRGDVVENLEAIRLNLTRCVDEGMLDLEDAYYNEISTLIDETGLCESWDDLEEVIDRAKILEVDIATWLAGHGQNSISLPWPKRVSTK